MTTYYAHYTEDGRYQTVSEHLNGTADRARAFAADFDPSLGAEDQAYVMGWLHDIGKFTAAFQRRLLQNGPIVDHSTAGAKEAMRKNVPEIAFSIAGHHSGLPDYGGNTDTEVESTLSGRLKRKLEDYSAWESEIPQELNCSTAASLFQKQINDPNLATYAYSFYIRMLYSCLVDADFLDTEAFMNGSSPGRGGYASMEDLQERVRQYVSGWWNPEKELNKIRCGILRQCFDKGQKEERGLFTMTVPTGGGKTVSSLAFALTMAKNLGMKRVIYVIPYTSIIDQNAKVFSEILGEENVVEHHSGVITETDESGDAVQYRKALATENWDAPVIVTTAVQFFESLYSCRSSKCRKLHNLSNSVIIFDEAQTIPIPVLRPCLAAVAQLVRYYRATAVLCTATQPSLKWFFDSAEGMHLPLREIVDQREGLSEKLRRTTIRVYGNIESLSKLAEILAEYDQFLCIVNRRATVQELASFFRDQEGCYSLTTLLYPKKRKEKIEEIRERLAGGYPCRVISTSLIEAGVDLDFPVVFREKSGLDSIIQAAGRCNREGNRSAESSKVWIFDLPEKVPKGIEQNTTATDIALKNAGEPDDEEIIRSYFDSLYFLKGREALDSGNIMKMIEEGFEGRVLFPFREVSEAFQMIDSNTTTIYVFEEGDEEGQKIKRELENGFYSRSLFRHAGQYGVNIYDQQFKALKNAGKIEICDKDVYLLADLSQYDPDMGLKLEVNAGEAVFV